jgi:mannosylglycerate hydrolase
MGDQPETAGQVPRRVVAVVPHTHWDREWYLPFQAFRMRLVELLDDLLPHLEADPGYAHFLLDGQLAVVDDHLAIRPGDEPRLRRLIGAGRIAVGPWYTLPDEFLVSGETLVRDLQLGFEKAAPLGGAMEVGYLPDMFGHVAQMPQILRQFGIGDAVVWRGVPTAVDRTAFRWVAPDGSEVRAEYLPAGYGNGARVPPDAATLVAQVDEFAERHAGLLDGGPVLWMNGTDHLLPQPWLAEIAAKADASQDRWHVVVCGIDEYLRRHAPPLRDDSPTWRGELRSGARANLLMGVTSNRTDVRVAAARAERALEQLAEPASALFLPPGHWPERLLAEAWLGVIRNAAHDSVCACSHDEVVDAVLHRYAEARQIGEGLAARAVEALGASVPHEGNVVVNLAPRARSGLVEVVVGAEPPEGCQVLSSRPAEADLAGYGSLGMAAGIVAELEYVERYTAARIVDAADGEELFATARDSGGQLVGPEDRSALEALMADGGAPRPCIVRVAQQPGHKVLARIDDLPGYGWRAWAPAPAPHLVPVTPVDRDEGGTVTITNGLVTVEPSWFRLVDGGDVGDTYNWCPPAGDPLEELGTTGGDAVEAGPLRGRLRIEQATADGAVAVTHLVELRAGEALVRVTTTIDNRRRDHRLRVHLPLPSPAATSEAECAFAVVTRGLEAEGGPTELALPTFPSRRFVRAGGLTVVHEGAPEYELVGIEGGEATELAITLLRCTGMLSQVPMATRPLPAGPFDRLEGPQLQQVVTVRWGLVVGDADPYAAVDDAFLPLRAVAGGAGLGTADRAAEGGALAVEGAEVSAVRRTAGGQLEVRVFNPTPEPVSCELPGRHGWRVDLRGRTQGPWEGRVPLAPWQLATLVLAD